MNRFLDRVFICGIVIIIIFGVGSPWALAMSVEEAYQSIPHRQTTFSTDQAQMHQQDRDYFQSFFELVDEALIERVSMLSYLKSQGARGRLAVRYNEILSRLRSLQPPRKVQKAHELVIRAIEEQKDFLEVWSFQGISNPQNYTSEELVQNSHRKLLKAYKIIKNAYPRERAHNQQAFFDHLCALDFI